VVADLKQQVKNLRQDLNLANIDSDRKSVALLTKVCPLLVDIYLLCMCVVTEQTETSICWILNCVLSLIGSA